jgi:hypothetical protein
VCRSTKPGATISPPASIVSSASSRPIWRGDPADLGDHAVLDADVAAKARQAAAVDDHAAADHAIETRHVSSGSCGEG